MNHLQGMAQPCRRLAQGEHRHLSPQCPETMQKGSSSWRRRATQTSSASSPRTATSPASWRTATGYDGGICPMPLKWPQN